MSPEYIILIIVSKQ